MEKDTFAGSQLYRTTPEKIYKFVARMRIGRTLPPAASPISLIDIIHALFSCLQPNIQDNQFGQEIRQEFDSKYCFFLSSGKAALTIILLALKEIYPDRDRVVLPAFTCYSVPAAVKRAGLQIKLCDLAPSSLDLDKVKLKDIIAGDKDKKILCVLPTHLFGCPEDIAEIRTIVGPEIPIIEDAAQAMGETFNNMKLGTLDDIGFFSLGRGKSLSTMGGGIIVTDRDDLAIVIGLLIAPLTGDSVPDILKLFLKTVLTTILQYPSLFWLPKALPFLRLGETLYEPDFSLRRLSSFHIQLARNWQKRLERHRRARKKNITYWQEKLPASFTRVCHATGNSLIRLPILAQTREQRDYILKQSEHQGLGIMPAYPTLINKIPELALKFSGQDYQRAEEICQCLLTLPVHEYLQDRDNERVLSLLKKTRC